VPDPKKYVGKIVRSLEKYFDVDERRIKVKSRPSLIIGFEPNYTSLLDIDFELLPISKLSNKTPDKVYDYLVDGLLISKLGLNEKSYIRTNKTTWNNVKHMKIEQPIGDLKAVDPAIFNHLLTLNEQWVRTRTINNLVPTTSQSTG